ncbi:unnamed protein product [Clonostachys rhizophaga]|uniref:DNA-directed RNA polymerase III subunit rpc5 n=1 Tax=Clonostachys rhizophaga TaxID=160324 RepID=A0A9N9V2G1_9HYPO|nr:unnamed protein product [Clonostachys rhizophaga]
MSVKDDDKMDTTVPDEENDPVTATYRVFLNPALPLGRRLLVLQHPNRTDDTARPPPTELRLKARTGMVEVDIPLDAGSAAYDREKGMKWGRNLKASMTAKSGGSHGLAGGFGVGAVQQRGGKKKDPTEDDDIFLDWNEAVRQQKVLATQTLGGQYPDVTDVQYMVGVFQGKDLHLTPVSELVHLRPQLHHIDATAYLERQSAAKDAPGSGAGAGAGAAGGAAAQARAIHMTIKNTAEGDRVTTETMADRLRNVQSEPWRKLRYTDENEEAAWDVYNESLFLRAKEDPSEADKGKGIEEEEPDLETAVPKFATNWGDDELLEAVSGIKKADREAEAAQAVKPEPTAPAVPPPSLQPTTPAARAPLRPRGGAAAARRGGRPRAPAKPGPSTTVNID